MSSGGPALVMVVDGDALVLRSYARMARQLGIRLAPASSAEQALELAQGGDAPMLFISAYRLPGMDGLRLLAELRERHPAATLVLSSGSMAELAPQPGILMLPKPVDAGTFTRLVEDARGH